MSTPDASETAAQLIADHLDKLPGTDGIPMRLMFLSTHGRPPHVAAQITQSRHDIAAGITRLLNQHGYRITR